MNSWSSCSSACALSQSGSSVLLLIVGNAVPGHHLLAWMPYPRALLFKGLREHFRVGRRERVFEAATVGAGREALDETHVLALRNAEVEPGPVDAGRAAGFCGRRQLLRF